MSLSTALGLTVSLLLQNADAQSIIAEVGPPVETGTNGTWARAIPTDDGWFMGVGTAGDFYVAPLLRTGEGLADWSFDRESWVAITDHGDLKDHAIQRCPDGSYLHVASANNREANDSAYAWRVSADFRILSSGIVEENNPDNAHNDMATICSPWVTGAVFSSFGTGGPPTASFFHIDESGSTSTVQELGELQVEGGAFLADAPTERIILTSANFDGNLELTTFDTELNPTGSTSVEIPPREERAFWPQSMIRVGQFYFVAMMSMVDEGPGSGDTGDVWLHVLDEDFNLLEQHKLTDYGSGRESAMRPWLARQDDLLLVSYDIQTTHTFLAVRLDLDGVDDVDTGFPSDGDDGAGAGEDGAAADEDEGKDGGCATGGALPGGGLFGALLALGLLSGRRRV
jgi:hypothetical protein